MFLSNKGRGYRPVEYILKPSPHRPLIPQLIMLKSLSIDLIQFLPIPVSPPSVKKSQQTP